MENSESPQLVAESEVKVRTFLESVTHLVPGGDRDENLSFFKKISSANFTGNGTLAGTKSACTQTATSA